MDASVQYGVKYLWEIFRLMANWSVMRVSRLDIRKVRKLPDRERYAELYFYFREAEQMIASNFPQAQRHGRRLKKRVENLYANWFGPGAFGGFIPQMASEL